MCTNQNVYINQKYIPFKTTQNLNLNKNTIQEINLTRVTVVKIYTSV